MRHTFAFLLLFISFLTLPIISFAYSSDICTGTVCDESKVGYFMQGISSECGNVGTCTLNDILTVVANVGNFILKVVGVIVFFMYVLGGFWWLISHGDSGLVTKGKKYLQLSTIGLIIVMIAYIGVNTLLKVLKTPSGGSTDVDESCKNKNIGDSCGTFNACNKEKKCISTCVAQGNICTNPNTAEAINNACFPGICPGEDVCCPPPK